MVDQGDTMWVFFTYMYITFLCNENSITNVFFGCCIVFGSDITYNNFSKDKTEECQQKSV